jgi:hypothetical protein
LLRHKNVSRLTAKAFERVETSMRDFLNTKMADAEANEDKDFKP